MIVFAGSSKLCHPVLVSFSGDDPKIELPANSSNRTILQALFNCIKSGDVTILFSVFAKEFRKLIPKKVKDNEGNMNEANTTSVSREGLRNEKE